MGCTHGKEHHNPDARRKTKLGKCVCGKCKSYKEYTSPTATKPLSFSQYVTTVPSGSTNWPSTNFLSNGQSVVTNFQVQYDQWPANKPTYTTRMLISQQEMAYIKTTSVIDYCLSKLYLDKNKVVVLRIDRQLNGSNGSMVIDFEYMEK